LQHTRRIGSRPQGGDNLGASHESFGSHPTTLAEVYGRPNIHNTFSLRYVTAEKVAFLAARMAELAYHCNGGKLVCITAPCPARLE
jgi:hypothetical protein